MKKYRILVELPTNTPQDRPIGDFIVEGDNFELKEPDAGTHVLLGIYHEGKTVAGFVDPISIVEVKE